VLNIVPGSPKDAGEAFVTHPQVDKVSITGSTDVGKNVMKQAAEQVKGVTRELDSESATISLDDADLAQAIDGPRNGPVYHHGHKEPAEKIKLGTAMNDDTDMGPLVSKKQQRTVLDYIEKGKAEGARLITGGTAPFDKGYYVEPTIFADVEDDMTIAREEIFGPVMAVMVFETIEEAISRANDSQYGLAASVWTENIKNGHYI